MTPPCFYLNDIPHLGIFGGIGVVNVASGRQAAWEESLRTGSLAGCFAMSHKKSDIGKGVPSLRRMLE